MDANWHTWVPRFTPEHGKVTTENFNESLWYLRGGVPTQPSPKKDGPQPIQDITFAGAPVTVRKAWIDTEDDEFYPSQNLKTDVSFGFARMSSNEEPADITKRSCQKDKMSMPHGVMALEPSVALTTPPRSISPNGMAPIGSEVAALKQRRRIKAENTHLGAMLVPPPTSKPRLDKTSLTQLQSGTDKGYGSHSRTKSHNTVATFRSGVSENDEFFYPPPGAKERFQLEKAKKKTTNAIVPSPTPARRFEPPTTDRPALAATGFGRMSVPSLEGNLQQKESELQAAKEKIEGLRHELLGKSHDYGGRIDWIQQKIDFLMKAVEEVRRNQAALISPQGKDVVKPNDKKAIDEKQFVMATNTADDVFLDPPDLGPGLTHFYNTQGYEHKGLTESLSACFGHVENALRTSPMVELISRPRSEKGVNILLNACQGHIMHRQEAYGMLEHEDERIFIITGILNRRIVDQIFTSAIFTEFECDYQRPLSYWCNQEALIFENDALNHGKRVFVGKQRAEFVNRMASLEDFDKWVQKHTSVVLGRILPAIEAAFQPSYMSTLRAKLWRPVNDAIRLAVRINQDPRLFTFHFLNVGCGWDSRFMIQRNPELVGQEPSNVRPHYVVRCTARPLIKIKNLETGDTNGQVIHRAEVLVTDRRKSLRPQDRPLRYCR